MSDRASEALAAGFLPREPRTYGAISKRKTVPLSASTIGSSGISRKLRGIDPELPRQVGPLVFHHKSFCSQRLQRSQVSYCNLHVSDKQFMVQLRIRIEWRRQPTMCFDSASLARGWHCACTCGNEPPCIPARLRSAGVDLTASLRSNILLQLTTASHISRFSDSTFIHKPFLLSRLESWSSNAPTSIQRRRSQSDHVLCR
jgi:hypothetical protein